MDGKITYHQQVAYCGKPRCRRCREGIGHGPYWYSYQTVNGRTVRTYIGKEAPPEALAATQADSSAISSSPEFANTLLRLYVLGQFRLEQRINGENGSPPHWQQVTESSLQHQRVRSLLSCLVSSPGRKLGREQVMYALWQELEVEVASHRLDRAVHSLRQVFEPGRSRPASSKLLLTEHATLTLADQSQFWVDADAFESLIAQGRALQESDPGRAERLMEEAMELYGGDFIPGEESIEWVTSRRESLRRSWISLLLELADLRLAREALPAALDVLDRLLGADPTNEAAVQRMIVLQAQMGRRGEAIQVYQRFAELIRQKYTIEPLPETRALYEKVRAGMTPVLSRPATRVSPGLPDAAKGGVAPMVPVPMAGVGAARDGMGMQGSGELESASFTPGGMPAVVPAHMHIGRTQQSPLVGRDQEMRRLYELLSITEGTRRQRLAGEKRSSLLAPLDLNAQRRPQCVILMGDVGIGKTRLAEEAAREAKRHNWAVAWCRAYTQESSVPYRLWTETLRKAMTQGLWQRSEVTRRPLIYQPLRSLLPELQDLLPRSLQMAPPPPEQEQLRLWESARALLSTICEGTNLLIVLDDVQWADSSSCEMLIYLVRQMRGQPVMFLCTCRDTELPPGHHLRPLLTDLQREQAVEIVPVTPLSDREIRELLAYLPAPVVESISERASGNPFFAEELARSIAGASEAANPDILPDTIQAVLDLRLARISERCRHILERGAVLGVGFQFEAIRDMASVSEDEMLDILEEGLQAGMLTEEGNGMRITYHFWHPLLQTYLYDHLSHARRANLHRRAAQALQNLHAGDEAAQAAEIADHLVKGGSAPSLVARYAELAADHAYSLSAYANAEKYYRLVLQHTPALSPTAPQEQRLHRAYVLERLGECVMILGKFEEARDFYEQVLEVRGKLVLESEEEKQYEAQIEALIWCEISKAWRYLRDDEKVQECFEHGEKVLTINQAKGRAAWAMIRYHQGHFFWREGNYERAYQAAFEALTIFNDTLQAQKSMSSALYATRTASTLTGNPDDLGRAHKLVADIVVHMGQSSEALQHFNTALEIFEKYDRKREIANVCCDLADLYLRRSEYTQARSLLMRSHAIVEKIGDAPVMSIVLINLGVLAARLGSLEEAESWYRQALHLITQMNELFYISLFHSYVAMALIELGKFDEAKYSLIQSLKISRSRHIAPCIGFALVALGHLRVKRALLNKGQAHERLSVQKRYSNEATKRLLHRASVTLKHALKLDGLEPETKLDGQLLLASIALLSDETENARELAEKALEEARSSELVWLQARAEYLLGQTLMMTGQRERAATLFRRALATFAETGMRLEHARASQAYAESLLQTSKDAATREQALRSLQEAHQTFEECGAALDLQMVERLLASMKDGRNEAARGARAGAAFTESGAGGHGQERRGR